MLHLDPMLETVILMTGQEGWRKMGRAFVAVKTQIAIAVRSRPMVPTAAAQ